MSANRATRARYARSVAPIDGADAPWFFDRARCPVCLRVNPTVAAKLNHCRHALCRRCLSEILRRDSRSACPVCRGAIVSYETFDRKRFRHRYVIVPPPNDLTSVMRRILNDFRSLDDAGIIQFERLAELLDATEATRTRVAA